MRHITWEHAGAVVDDPTRLAAIERVTCAASTLWPPSAGWSTWLHRCGQPTQVGDVIVGPSEAQRDGSGTVDVAPTARPRTLWSWNSLRLSSLQTSRVVSVVCWQTRCCVCHKAVDFPWPMWLCSVGVTWDRTGTTPRRRRRRARFRLSCVPPGLGAAHSLGGTQFWRPAAACGTAASDLSQNLQAQEVWWGGRRLRTRRSGKAHGSYRKATTRFVSSMLSSEEDEIQQWAKELLATSVLGLGWALTRRFCRRAGQHDARPAPQRSTSLISSNFRAEFIPLTSTPRSPRFSLHLWWRSACVCSLAHAHSAVLATQEKRQTETHPDGKFLRSACAKRIVIMAQVDFRTKIKHGSRARVASNTLHSPRISASFSSSSKHGASMEIEILYVIQKWYGDKDSETDGAFFATSYSIRRRTDGPVVHSLPAGEKTISRVSVQSTSKIARLVPKIGSRRTSNWA